MTEKELVEVPSGVAYVEYSVDRIENISTRKHLWDLMSFDKFFSSQMRDDVARLLAVEVSLADKLYQNLASRTGVITFSHLVARERVLALCDVLVSVLNAIAENAVGQGFEPLKDALYEVSKNYNTCHSLWLILQRIAAESEGYYV